MKSIYAVVILILMFFAGCDPEPAGPETDCILKSEYELAYGFTTASKVFDIRTSPPTEIKDGHIEYDLFYQWQRTIHDNLEIEPYISYYIDHASFKLPDQVMVAYHDGFSRVYNFIRDDCRIDFFGQNDTLHAELFKKGDEISFDRYAIYDYVSRPAGVIDTFIFIEFRDKNFRSYEQIIDLFAKANTGLYDTIGIELVTSRTKE